MQATHADRKMVLTGRVLMALVFIVSGLAKMATAHVQTTGYVASEGMPLSIPLALIVGFAELAAGVLLAWGFKLRAVAIALAVWMLTNNGLFHRFWEVEPEFEFAQQILFYKNLGLAAGLLVLAGSASLFVREE